MEKDVYSLELDSIAAAFAALDQPSRLKIVRLLLSAYPNGWILSA